MKHTKILLTGMLISIFSIGVLNAETNKLFNKFKIGDEEKVKVSTQHPYSTEKQGIAFEKEFYREGSGYIKIHFKNFDLADGDFVEIVSPATMEKFIYQGKGKVVRGGEAVISEFWSQSIWSDHVIVRLHTNNVSGKYGFDIDRVAYGFSALKIQKIFEEELKTICGNDDKEWAKCYEGTTMYEKAKAVSRLYIGGQYACTGWLLGNEGHLMTNNHCIENQSDADNTEYEFMGEGATCNTACNGWLSCRGEIEANSGTLIKTNSNYDYSLVKLPGNLSNTYGYLSFRSTLPSVGERIYIPQHPGAKGKQLSVWDDQANDYAKINTVSSTVRYFADTEGGSSGSPVIAYSDNLVVALHNSGSCSSGNGGYRNTSIISDLGSLMPNGGVDDGGPGGDGLTISVNGSSVELPSFVGYSGQDRSGGITVNGAVASMNGNSWKAASLNYNITSNTKLEFDFSSTDEGEFHAIGLENNLEYNDAVRCFMVYGTQNWSGVNQDYNNYSGGTKHYTIPIGNYYTGSASYLALVNDNDAGSGNSTFSNISIYEGGSGQCNKSPVTLTIKLDNYPEETSWEVTQGSTSIASGGTYGHLPDGSTVTETINLNSGNFTFTIKDSYGDGICCGYGNGNYTLKDNNGATIASGGQFGSSESTNFCIGESIKENTTSLSSTEVNDGFKIYPNPFNSSLNINYTILTSQDVSIEIYNSVGQKIAELVNYNHEPGIYTLTWDGTTSNGNTVSKGIYYCRMTAGENIRVDKVIFIE